MNQRLKKFLSKLFRLFKLRQRGFEFTSKANQYSQIPKRGTEDSAGYDFYLTEDVSLEPGQTSKIISTGIKAYMKRGEVLKLFIRSSVGIKKSVRLSNCTGIIDADYYNNPDNEGDIGFVLINDGDIKAEFKAGERIAQGIFEKYLVADNDEACGKRKGRTGSTGV